MIKTQKIRRLSDVYHLKVMDNYVTFRFGTHCPEGYVEYKVFDQGDVVSFELKNGHKLYCKDN